MKIGIIVHSHTGNTLSVAEKLKDKLLATGYSVELERVSAEDENPNAKGPVVLQTSPDPSKYDFVIFGAPVRAFSLSPVMQAYLAQVPSLADKKTGCFVTQHFPFPWMGGKRSLGQMEKACADKGAVLSGNGIVNWSHKQREAKIQNLLDLMGSLVKE